MGLFKQKRSLNSIISEEKFREILRQERARVERSGLCFSLVEFNYDCPKGIESLIKDFLQVISSRIRKTDVIGWLDSIRIGIMLFNTNYDNASFFAKEIQKTIAIKYSSPNFKVHTYSNSKQFTNEINEINKESQEHSTFSRGNPNKSKDF